MGSNSVSWVSNPALGCTQNLRSWTYSNAACNTTVMKDGIFATLEIPQVEIFGKVNTEQLWNLLFNNLMRSKWSFWLGFGETSPRKDSKNLKIKNLVCIIYTGIIFLYLLVLTILVRFLQILILSRSGSGLRKKEKKNLDPDIRTRIRNTALNTLNVRPHVCMMYPMTREGARDMPSLQCTRIEKHYVIVHPQ